MEFIYDQLIIIGSYLLSYLIVHRNADIKKLLVPIPVTDKYTLGEKVMFRFIPLSRAKTDVPYNILILLLFLILAVLTKALFNNNDNWLLFWVGYLSIFLILLSITYKLIVIIFIVAIYSIPTAILLMLDIHLDPKWMGIIAGIIPGVFGGIYIGINYWIKRAQLENEIHFKQDLEGEALGFISLTLRRLKRIWLKWSPLLTLIAVVGFVANWNKAVGSSIGSTSIIYQYGAVFLWTLISLNIFLFSVPLLIQMVQQASWTSAGLFSDKIQDKEADEIKPYLNRFGKYSGFSLATSLILGMMCLAIGATIAGGVIEKLILGEIISQKNNYYLFQSATFLSGFIFSVHIGFILVYGFFALIPRRFRESEIINPKAIIRKIIDCPDKLFQDLRKILDDSHERDLKEILNDSDDEAREEVCEALNSLLKTKDLHKILKLDETVLGEESRMLLNMARYGQVKKRINKHVLADIFKDEIKRNMNYLRDALTFREYVYLKKKGLRNKDMRFYLDADRFFYPTIDIAPEDRTQRYFS